MSHSKKGADKIQKLKKERKILIHKFLAYLKQAKIRKRGNSYDIIDLMSE